MHRQLVRLLGYFNPLPGKLLPLHFVQVCMRAFHRVAVCFNLIDHCIDSRLHVGYRLEVVFGA